MTNLTTRLAFYPVILLVYAILLIPVVVVIATSLTVQSSPTLPTDGVTLEWYATLFQNQRLIDAMIVSTIVACATAVVAGIIGTITAFGFVRSETSGKETLATIMLLPLMISPVITGVAFLRFGGLLSIPRGYPQIILAHSILALPFVFLIVRSRLLTFDDRLEDASMIMGANRLETTLNVTIPVIAPAMIAGMLIAFVISFGEFTATQFLVTPGTTTVPIIIFNQIQTGLSPEISALATTLVAIMIIVSVLGDRIGG
ncbi:spermidine/putrescine transport system permease protein [Natronorubrum sediminis]|uniref:Spermidine/putrescine transport system permease protein n=1 Tax=Natronorubrum sediminis TaxID=640943 RepID=A0A1H6G4L3_9EURY|nr:ABC transporter permease [Natronorubrum sediminis]SEH17263.1 spermidine/putrescine transport system permease protein [Natronorubrum sediminis]